MVSNCLALPMPAQASRGILAPVIADISSELSGSVERMPSYNLTEDNTLGEWSEEFIRANPSYKNGDKVTFIAVVFTPNEEVPLEKAYNASVIVRELPIDTTSTEFVGDYGFSLSPGNSYMGLNRTTLSLSDNGLAAGDNIVQTAVIGSSKGVNGELLTSSEYFTLSAAARDLYEEFRTDAALQNAISSYGAVANSVLSV